MLQIFAAEPDPGPPAWKMFFPIASRIGLARVNALSEPPAMKVRLPASAPTTPPDMGLSSIAWPRASAASDTARAVATSMVEQSMNSVPGPALSRAPPSPRYALRTWREAGSAETIADAPSSAAPSAAKHGTQAASAASRARRGSIASPHFVTGPLQVAGHWQSHVAEAGKRDPLGHGDPPPAFCEAGSRACASPASVRLPMA